MPEIEGIIQVIEKSQKVRKSLQIISASCSEIRCDNSGSSL